jgi:antitoxin ParD1/3/4
MALINWLVRLWTRGQFLPSLSGDLLITKIAIFGYKAHDISGAVSMNVSLTPELEELIAQKVQSGRYTSASEVVREALRLLEEHDEIRQKRLEAMQREINEGLAQLDRGEGIPGDQVRALLRRNKK